MDYEKAYKEVLERARKVYNGKYKPEVAAAIAEKLPIIFHELKESEYEKVRKNCIHFLELQKSHHAAAFEIEECIAWLEGQKEVVATPQDWNDYRDKPVEVWNAYVQGKVNGIEVGKKIERQLRAEAAEWSDADEQMRQDIIAWLKSLHPLPEQERN